MRSWFSLWLASGIGLHERSEIMSCKLIHMLSWQPFLCIAVICWFWSAISQSSVSFILCAMWSLLLTNPVGLGKKTPLIFRRGLCQDQCDGLGAALETWPRYLNSYHIQFSRTFTAAFPYFGGLSAIDKIYAPIGTWICRKFTQCFRLVRHLILWCFTKLWKKNKKMYFSVVEHLAQSKLPVRLNASYFSQIYHNHNKSVVHTYIFWIPSQLADTLYQVLRIA